MKNNRHSSRLLIAVLSCMLILLSCSVCLIFIYKVGSYSVDALSVPSAVLSNETSNATKLLPSTSAAATKAPSKTVQSLPPVSLFPDVSVPLASPDPDFVLSNSTGVDNDINRSPADIIENVKDGVVAILNYHYNTRTGKYFAYGTSSGFIVSKSGYILTNAHAVSDAKKLEVTFSDNTTVEAHLVGYDLTTDIAVIKVPESSIKCCLELGDSDSIRVGEYVLAMGNPISSESLYGTVSLGIVSGKNREMNIDGFLNSYIQTDAALNPGNSGGPLFDMNGRVVGMNTAKAISAGYDDYGNPISSEGIGFSLPINDVIAIANILIQNGMIPRPGIGITVYTLTAENAASINSVEGVWIDSVSIGGPAQNAGLEKGDVIVRCNDQPIKDKDVLVEIIRSVPIESTVELTVFRKGEYLTFTVLIGNMNDFKN